MHNACGTFVVTPSEASSNQGHAALAPSSWIVRHAALISAGARVLDLACGSGRHARLLARCGANVVAVDRDGDALRALADIPGIATCEADLEAGPWPFEDEQFDAIVVVNYLHRALFRPLLASLADDGALLYETFALGNERHGRPSNPAFLLAPDELLDLSRDKLRVVAFEQGEVISPDRGAVVQRLAAVGRARTWPPLLAAAIK